jgi:hypothetical protein
MRESERRSVPGSEGVLMARPTSLLDSLDGGGGVCRHWGRTHGGPSSSAARHGVDWSLCVRARRFAHKHDRLLGLGWEP